MKNMTHKEAFIKLMKGDIPQKIADVIYEKREMNDEIVFAQGFDNIREYNPPCGDHKNTWVDNDAVIIYIPQGKACKNTVAIEIKDRLSDLLEDSKMRQYIGSSDYYFLAVTSVLIIPALVLLMEISSDNDIGLIDLDNEEVVVVPGLVNVDAERRRKLLAMCCLNPKRCPGSSAEYCFHAVIPHPCYDDYSDYRGIRVNQKYLGLLKNIIYHRFRWTR